MRHERPSRPATRHRLALPLAVAVVALACGGSGSGSPRETRDPRPVPPAAAGAGGSRAERESAGKARSPAAGRPAGTVVFHRMAEPREHAFTLLVPDGWSIAGGIVRVDPIRRGGAAQSIEAKVDFAVKRDPAGTVMIRWLPDTWYIDARMTPAGQMGLFPPGSNYNGMTVMPAPSAAGFLERMAFPSVHPGAANVQVIERRALPELVRASARALATVAPPLAGRVRYDAALVRLRYTEGGRRFEEVMVTVIENMGQIAAGMWRNRSAFYFRAPVDSYRRWEPVIAIVQGSVRLDPRWVTGEIRGQAARSDTLLRTQAEINRIGREIAEHQARTNAEIQNDMYLTFTGQEEYVNPFTGQVETGTSRWRHRWENRQGDVVYTDSGSYDPNTDIQLNISGFKRSPVRPRRVD